MIRGYLVALTSLLLPVAAHAHFTLEEVADDIDRPLDVTHAPGDFDRVFVASQGGQIYIIEDGDVLDDPFLDISALMYTFQNPQGLLAMAFHPDYATNGHFFVNYTSLPDGRSVVARYTVSADPDVADAGSAHGILELVQPSPAHNLAWMGFSPIDGYLYIASGDGGGPYDPGDEAQNIDDLLGKILRIDIDGDDFPLDRARNYAIPSDNPFVGIAGLDQIWAYGVRHPWRCSFDRLTGDLYIADVGETLIEELSFLPAGVGGKNLGWDCLEGHMCTPEVACMCGDPDLVAPIWTEDHPLARSIVGGYVYRGSAIPALYGQYVVADFGSSRGWRLLHDGTTATYVEDITEKIDDLGEAIHKPAGFGEDAAGELYVCAWSQGRVLKFVPAELDCPADLDDNDIVGITDFLLLLGSWDTPGADVDGDGTTGINDFLLLLGAWGPCR